MATSKKDTKAETTEVTEAPDEVTVPETETVQVIATRSFDNITQGERFSVDMTPRIQGLIDSGILKVLEADATDPVTYSYQHIAMAQPASQTYPVTTPGAFSQYGESAETQAALAANVESLQGPLPGPAEAADADADAKPAKATKASNAKGEAK